MKKKVVRIILSIAVLLGITLSSLLVAAKTKYMIIEQDATINRDLFFTGSYIENNGIIKGDALIAAEFIVSKGTVEGDFIGAADSIETGGIIKGDFRAAGKNIVVNSNIGKNVNLLAGQAYFDNAEIKGSINAFCKNIEINGKVEGYVRIYGGTVTLKGQFNDDVYVNLDNPYGKNSPSKLIIEPGTVIKGNLVYKGYKEAEISSQAQIAGFKWEKTDSNENKAANNLSSWPVEILSFLKMLIASSLYFLIALGFYKLFPGLFEKQVGIIRYKAANVIGVGLIALFSVFVFFLFFILITIFSAIFANPSIGLFFGAFVAIVYFLLFYLSLIPVSLWLGNLILGQKATNWLKLAVGIFLFKVVFHSMSAMSKIMPANYIFPVLSLIIRLSVAVVGIGTILYITKDALKELRKI